jgi:trk/ktr system potassium uptake protein
MKIIILGAGRTGTSLTTTLAREANDIVVVDNNLELLRELKEKLDIATVLGHAAHPPVLERAGIQDADMLIAVTDKDETNIVACQIAHCLYQTKTKIARVRAIEFASYMHLFSREGIPVDLVISPEQIIMQFFRGLIECPGTQYVSDFADGKIRLVSMRVTRSGFLVGKRIRELRKQLQHQRLRFVAIYREGRAIAPNGDTVIEERDEVFFVAPKEKINDVLADMRKSEAPYKRLLFAGGGHVGVRLAMALENRFQIKIIEKDGARAEKIANLLNRTIVLQGDAVDTDLLSSENIEKTDVFCALTENDGINILSSTLAKQLGARKALCIINHPLYESLVKRCDIDATIIPQEPVVSQILKFLRHSDVVQVSGVRGGTAEALEAVIHKKRKGSEMIGRRVDQLRLPSGVILGALVRDGTPIPIHHDTVFHEGDHVVMFLMEKDLIPIVEKLFVD